MIYGKVGQCNVNGAATITVKNKAVVQKIRVINSDAVVNIDLRGIVKAIEYVPNVTVNNKNKKSPPIMTPHFNLHPPPIIPFGGGGGFATPTIYVNSIIVTAAGGASTVAYGSTLQMSAAVLPTNAANKTITWSVAPATGTATISASGLLTGTKVGEVTVIARNAASGVQGTKLITVTATTDVEPQDFGVMDYPEVKGYNVGFNLLDAKASDVESVEVKLYNGTTLLATNTSTGLLTQYPNAVQLVSAV